MNKTPWLVPIPITPAMHEITVLEKAKVVDFAAKDFLEGFLRFVFLLDEIFVRLIWIVPGKGIFDAIVRWEVSAPFQ